MKRKIFILVALFMLFGITATAENVGDVIGAVYINSIYKDGTAHNWLSCDSYPICYNPAAKQQY